MLIKKYLKIKKTKKNFKNFTFGAQELGARASTCTWEGKYHTNVGNKNNTRKTTSRVVPIVLED
jgi:hypothetical protein